jgi:hypothetical protein
VSTLLLGSGWPNTFTSMRLYALVEAGDPEAIDVYLCEEMRSARSRTAFAMNRSGAIFFTSRRSSFPTCL